MTEKETDRSETPKERWSQWADELSGFLQGRHRLGHYILDENRNPVETDLLTAAEWFDTADRQVGSTLLSGGVEVSTVFLGLITTTGSGPPLLFETAVFRPEVEIIERYATWEEAETGHGATVIEICTLENRTIEREDPLGADIIE